MIRILEESDEEKALSPSMELEAVALETFGSGGVLEVGMGLEHRPEQAAMAVAVAQAFAEGESLLFEAGTGVGKSLAYLVPGVVHAVASNRPFVVATNTISLQEQLLNQDIPMVRDIFRKAPNLAGFADFRSALLVGKANYLCDNRLAAALGGQGELFETGQRAELERIREWAAGKPKAGIRQELSPTPRAEVWDAVNADSSLCSSKCCSPETCCYRRARAEVDKAHLLVVNHSLLFALVGAGAAPGGDVPGVLFPRDIVVLDEGHEVPDVASDHLGLGISSWAVSLALKRLYNPAKKKGGLLRRIGKTADFELVENAQIACEDFFNHIHVSLLEMRDLRRLLEPGSLPTDLFPPMS
ncbi:MAG: ATP-dependent DNA helicase, partial [Opitutales bacterium]